MQRQTVTTFTLTWNHKLFHSKPTSQHTMGCWLWTSLESGPRFGFLVSSWSMSFLSWRDPWHWNCAVLVFWFFLKPRHSLMGIDMQNYHELPYFLEKVALVTNLHQSLKILHVKTFFHRLQDFAWLCGKKIIPWERIAWVTKQSTAFGPRFQCGLAKAWWISVQLWEVFGTPRKIHWMSNA